MQPEQTRKRDVFATARETLIDAYGTADPAKLRRQGRADETELRAADGIARRAVETLAVGSLVFVPNRLKPGQLGYALGVQLYAEPGPIVSIDEDGWAMVDLGRWGEFGCSLADLRPADPGVPGGSDAA
jgi:hypothetical protein